MPLANDDNVRTTHQNYGVRGTDTQYGGETAGDSGQLRKVEFVFDYDELPAYDSENLAQVLPADAIIQGAAIDFITAFTSTSGLTDLTVGLADDDGGATITDADGIFTAAELTEAVINSTDRVEAAAGALIGTTVAEKSQLTVAPSTADLLTGRARVSIYYTQVPAAGAI